MLWHSINDKTCEQFNGYAYRYGIIVCLQNWKVWCWFEFNDTHLWICTHIVHGQRIIMPSDWANCMWACQSFNSIPMQVNNTNENVDISQNKAIGHQIIVITRNANKHLTFQRRFMPKSMRPITIVHVDCDSRIDDISQHFFVRFLVVRQFPDVYTCKRIQFRFRFVHLALCIYSSIITMRVLF